jgi:two-component system, chemotaxis family, response regulator Rcp1
VNVAAAAPVVLVEDAEADAAAARRMLRKLRPDVELEVYVTGEALLTALDAATPRLWWPRLFIIDVNLAGRTGIEVLQTLKASPWARVPVVVLSGSASDSDVQRCYDLGAAGYLTKPMGSQQMTATWVAITSYWLDAAVPTVPPRR